ncbi:MAG: hypothetical protein J0I68_10990 [Achromobacter sp.]|uniref:DUF2975 domain-containing protein n=1 Tax=Achromobacter insuavis TaxID=1287735 RepID=A0A6J4ZJY4_9BURK|nr:MULTISPECIES: hypothetical protein [Achromobacter]MBN9639055.1 hypothetical protein [Achromobacter sp.]CAB3632820.1 hypothetical protein LMG26845_01010 [Achromobacter insuavis]CUI31173.1 Protein of uncharacterised function (DUF2975) [Achromobacter sp. 2789STDY5608628]CUI54966.1 Protein of uncharacterised function (DUF2975) [Achromobacter sp. 2789STDY5608633]CUJ90275.1 Protein of uncharacterised function (DUF2975) [Achromobacter sp. 2789STDY5608615]
MAAALTPPTARQKAPARQARNRLERIRGLSRWMRGLLIAAAVLLVAAMIGMWFFTSEAVLARGIYSFLGVTPSPTPTDGEALRISLSPTLNAPRLQLGFGYRVLGFALFGVLAGLALRGIAHAYAMFTDFGRGDVLTVATARRLRGIAALVTAFSVAVPVLKTVLVLALTLANGPGGRHMLIDIDVSDILLALLGGLLFSLAWAMEEAAHVAEENRGFI